MTAAVGFPTLRLIRRSIGPYSLGNLAPGEHIYVDPEVNNSGFHKETASGRRTSATGATGKRQKLSSRDLVLIKNRDNAASTMAHSLDNVQKRRNRRTDSD